MNKQRFNKAALLSLPLIPLLLLVPGAFASPPVAGSGTFTATTSSLTIVHSNDGNTLYFATGSIVFTGTLVGTGTFTLRLLVHPSGASEATGSNSCLCSVNGQKGTIDSQFASSGTFGGSGAGQIEEDGSGGLAGFHAVGDFQFITTATGFTGPYQIQYHFEG